jgi:LysR family glycine cleavage system transcriptional activator
LDWSRATLIHTSSVAEDWETWCNQSQTDISAARKLVLGTAQLSLEAAAGGLGIAMGRLPLIDDDIAAGQLAMAIGRPVPVASGYWLVKPPGIETRREIFAFRNWLLKEMSPLNWRLHDRRSYLNWRPKLARGTD